MPSHIFTHLGLWSESVQSNAESARAAKPDGYAQGELHAMDYMAYAHLQLVQDAKAKRVVDHTVAFGKIERETAATAYAQASIPARYALERRRWSEAAELPVIGRPDRYTHVVGISYFARAVGAARSGDAAAARREVERLQVLRETLLQAERGYWADQVEVQRRAAAGWLTRAEGKNEEALALVRSAADLEDSDREAPSDPGAGAARPRAARGSTAGARAAWAGVARVRGVTPARAEPVQRPLRRWPGGRAGGRARESESFLR